MAVQVKGELADTLCGAYNKFIHHSAYFQNIANFDLTNLSQHAHATVSAGSAIFCILCFKIHAKRQEIHKQQQCSGTQK